MGVGSLCGWQMLTSTFVTVDARIERGSHLGLVLVLLFKQPHFQVVGHVVRRWSRLKDTVVVFFMGISFHVGMRNGSFWEGCSLYLLGLFESR